jgi:4,5-DOPA dioxygenase extradiol
MLPSVFVSHGAPTLLMESGATPGFLRGLGATLGRPRAVVCISAHWETAEPRLTAAEHLPTIHDFYGFPEALYRERYPAPGDPLLAERAATLLRVAGHAAELDETRGLDHGAWVPLKLMYPQADVPVVQLSLQTERGPHHHRDVGRALQPLREEGVLILGSGGATHNLREFRGQAIDTAPPAYVRGFDEWLADAVGHGRVDELLDYERAPNARRNHPTAEHFLPLLVAMGAAHDARGRQLQHAFSYGVLSMAAYAWD